MMKTRSGPDVSRSEGVSVKRVCHLSGTANCTAAGTGNIPTVADIPGNFFVDNIFLSPPLFSP